MAAARRGAIVLVSNSSAPDIEAAYRSRAAQQAGLMVRRIAARRAINSRATARGPVDELIISNVPAGPRGDAIETPRGTRPTPHTSLRGSRPTTQKLPMITMRGPRKTRTA